MKNRGGHLPLFLNDSSSHEDEEVFFPQFFPYPNKDGNWTYFHTQFVHELKLKTLLSANIY